jgi:hypothetical protein
MGSVSDYSRKYARYAKEENQRQKFKIKNLMKKQGVKE